MSVADDMRAGAIDVFNSLTGVPIQCTYRSLARTYVPGGQTSITVTEYPIRMIRETSIDATVSTAGDVSMQARGYMFIPSELPVEPTVKDEVVIGGVMHTVFDFGDDPVDAVTTLRVIRR